MAHFAKIENGIVTDVLVIDNAHEVNGEEYLNSIGIPGKWVQTSYSASFGKKFASIGDTYVASTGNFKPAKPFGSWKFDDQVWGWIAPKPVPSDGKTYRWDEDSRDWLEA